MTAWPLLWVRLQSMLMLLMLLMLLLLLLLLLLLMLLLPPTASNCVVLLACMILFSIRYPCHTFLSRSRKTAAFRTRILESRASRKPLPPAITMTLITLHRREKGS